MCIYCNTSNYRKIYKKHFGPIPIDLEGRTYHIHHKDGNRKNNDPSNLEALSVQEHYDRHYEQGDWAACIRLSKIIKKSKEEISKIARKNQLKRLKNKTHYFLTEQNKKRAKAWNKERINNGTHPLLKKNMLPKTTSFKKSCKDRQLKKIEEGTHPFFLMNRSELNEKTRIRESEKFKKGIHPFQKSGYLKNVARSLLENGNHQCQKLHCCPHCNKFGKGNAMFRFHFENCKLKV